MALVETRKRTLRPSASEMKVTLHRFGRKRRLVLIFEWLTLWPTCGPLAVNSQRRDILEILFHPGFRPLSWGGAKGSKHGDSADSGVVLGLTFAFRARGSIEAKCQIRPTENRGRIGVDTPTVKVSTIQVAQGYGENAGFPGPLASFPIT